MNSQFFQAIANLLRLIENLNAPSDQYGVADSGQTLELSEAVYNQIKDSSELKEYESLGGSWYCYDSNELDEWEPNPCFEEDLSLSDLFALSDKIGNKYVCTEELDERCAQLTAIADEVLAKYPLL